jgi:hypothetical protein
MIARGVYPVSQELIDWLTHTWEALEECAFAYYRQIVNLVEMVRSAEEGRIPKYAVLAAIRDRNKEDSTSVTYEEIRDLNAQYLFSDCGQWVAFTSDPRAILLGEYDDAETAFEKAPPHINSIFVWDTEHDVVVVYRSPHVGLRKKAESSDPEVVFGEGLDTGTVQTYVLPPEIEACYRSNYTNAR